MPLLIRLQLIFGTIVVLAILLLETVPRVVAVPGLGEQDLRPIAAELKNARVRPHPYLAYANKPDFHKPAYPNDPHEIRHNSLGYRGPEITLEKPEGAYRIVCLGGSSTYGHGPSSNAMTWPAQLEARLREAHPGREIQVINGGCQGYSSFESLINFEIRMVDLKPDLVLVYHSINDVRCALYPVPVPDNAHWRANWPVERPSKLYRWLEKNSYTFLTARRYLTDYKAARSNLGAYAIVGFEPGQDDPYYKEDPPLQGFRNFHRNLVSIVALAKRHGSRVMFATQANDASDLAGAASRDTVLQGMQMAAQTLRAVAQEEELPLVEAATALEAEAQRQIDASGSENIFTHEVHLSDKGCEMLSRLWFERIESEGLIP